MEKYLETGKIVNTHGVRGTVKAETWSDTPQTVMQLPCIYFKKGQAYLPIKILHASQHKSHVLLDLEGCTDLDQALQYKDTIFYADRNDISCKDGQYFIADLIGLSVFDFSTKQCYGTLSSVFNRGASDIYEIKMPNQKMAYLPAVAEFVAKIDLKQGIFVTPIPGFFDEWEASVT